MSSIARGVREYEERMRDAKEILIPFPAAKARYGVAVAKIIDQLNESSASDAKDKKPEQFKWYLAYTQPSDPSARTEAEFVQQLIDDTTVFLVCRGFRWKGASELKEMPEQIRARYEERARLVLSAPAASEHGLPPPPMSNLEEDVNNVLASLSALKERHPVDSVLMQIALLAVRNIKKR